MVKLELQPLQGGRRKSGCVVGLEAEPVVGHERHSLSENITKRKILSVILTDRFLWNLKYTVAHFET